MRGNAIMGVIMLAVGVYFFLAPSGNIDPTVRIVFLAGYLAVAAFYLGRAFLQYRSGN